MEQANDHSTKMPCPNSKLQPLRRRLIRAFVLYAAVPYLAVVVIFTVLQRRLMYRPVPADSLLIRDLEIDPDFAIDVQQETMDGQTIRGWLVNGRNVLGNSGGPKPLVIYYPGNSLNRHRRINDLREMASRGFDVLIFDYRGFGDSTGSPSEAALSNDALLVWRFAVETLGYSEDQIVVFGESIGGAVSLSLWAETAAQAKRPAALILSSTFTSMPAAVQWNYPLFPFHWLLLDRWPSIDRIANVPSPVVVFHGTEDQMIPSSHGQELTDAARNATFIEIAGGMHNEIPSMALREVLDDILVSLQANPTERKK